MNGLILHCGAHAISRSALAELPLPAPKGPRHAIRPYIEDIGLVERELGHYGLEVVDEAFGVTHDGNRFFGIMEVEPVIEGDYISKHDAYRVMVGLRGSYDQSIARGLAVGSRVFVCDNLSFSGEVQILTKQTLRVNDRMPELLRQATAKVPMMANHQAKRFEHYRHTKLTQRQGDACITEFVRRGIVNPSQVGRVIQEWDEPSHVEHAEDGYSVWRMHNAVTEGTKPQNKDRLAIPAVWARTIPLTSFLDDVAGLQRALAA